MTDDAARMPPQDIEAERAVLGAVLRENDRLAVVNEVVTHAGMFYHAGHKVVWGAMVEMYRSAVPIDLLTLSDALRKGGNLEAVGGVSYLSRLLDATPTAAHALHHAKIVREKAVLRGVINVSRNLTERALGDEVPPEDLLDDSLRSLVALRAEADPGGPREVGRVLVDVFRDIDGDRRGLPTGFRDLDQVVSGLEPGNFVVIAARPSIGKTAFALSIIRHLALKRKEPVGVAYFYLEAGDKDLGYRLLAAEAGSTLALLKRGRLAEGEYERLTDAAKIIHEAPIHIDDSARLTATKIRGRAWQMKVKDDGLGVVIVDHIGRMGVEDRRLGRERQVAESSEALANMAKHLGVVVIALSQLNRECEGRADKKPQLSDLRESGSLEQDADLVLLLHRPGHYVDLRPPKGDHHPSEATVIVAKQRDGPTGEVAVRFDPATCTFGDKL